MMQPVKNCRIQKDILKRKGGITFSFYLLPSLLLSSFSLLPFFYLLSIIEIKNFKRNKFKLYLRVCFSGKSVKIRDFFNCTGNSARKKPAGFFSGHIMNH